MSDVHDAGAELLEAAAHRSAACVHGLNPLLINGCWCPDHWPSRGDSPTSCSCAQDLARGWASVKVAVARTTSAGVTGSHMAARLVDIEVAFARQLPELGADVLPVLTELTASGLGFAEAVRVVAALPGAEPGLLPLPD